MLNACPGVVLLSVGVKSVDGYRVMVSPVLQYLAVVLWCQAVVLLCLVVVLQYFDNERASCS